MNIRVADNPAESRYEVLVDGRVAGLAAYRLEARRIVFVHTEVDPSHEGEGLGGELAREALDDVRRRGLAVVPLCPFIRGFIRRHPEFLDLVAPEHRDRVSATGLRGG